MNLIEVIVALAIVSFLLSAGAPSMLDWIQNVQIRSAAETIASGLQLARAEALRRNADFRFQFTSSLDNGCVLSAASVHWVVSRWDPTGACGAAPSDTVAPRIVQTSSAGETAGNVRVTADQAVVIFSGLGVQRLPGSLVKIDIVSFSAACAGDGGAAHCLRVLVSPLGQIRLCDPALAASGDPQGCD